MTIHRRSILLGLFSSLAAPAIVHAGNIMPVRLFQPWSPRDIPGLLYWNRVSKEECATLFAPSRAPTGGWNYGHPEWIDSWRKPLSHTVEVISYGRRLSMSECAQVEQHFHSLPEFTTYRHILH